MPQYRYKSIDQKGKIRTGRMFAANILDMEQRLAVQKHDLVRCDEVKAKRMRFSRRKVQRKDLINMLFHLEQMTKSGVSLLDGLKDLRDSVEEGYFRDVLASLVESIEGGKTFSESLRDFPNDFDNIFVSLVSVGEESGELPRILKDMADTLRWADELVAAMTKIIMYPAIVGVVVFSVTAFLMIYLVPQIIPFVEEMGGEIPGHTKLLIKVSDTFVQYWWLLIGLPVVLFWTVRILARKRPDVRFWVDTLKLKIPVIGPIALKIKLSRVVNYMALLYSSGITILKSLDICRELVGNVVLEQALDQVKENIADGGVISDSFEQVGFFPPLVIRMVKVGEMTGGLDEALLNVGYFYSREVQEAIDSIEPAISPILTVVMGTVLGWIMLSVLGPIWDSIAQV